MSIYKFKEYSPEFDKSVFIAPTADLIGNIKCGKDSNFWFGVIVRGDMAPIIIGENVNIQDSSMLHVDSNMPLNIGDNVSVGHKSMLHACTIGNSCLIGMGAILLDGCVIGENSVVAAGSVVPPGKIYPSGSMIMGSPAKVVRNLSEQEKKKYANHYKSYIKLKNIYLSKQVSKLTNNTNYEK